ncbi:MAG: hypothetical protein JO081_07460, partial [Alphaproteobacteria bacterium]|nr:hypothetical protein [Alphaproteobacteria bacterium]
MAALPARGQQYSAPAGTAGAPPPQPVLAVPPPPPPVNAPPPLVPPPAPPPTFTSGLQLIAYPYLWLPHLNMAITTPLQRAPQVNISAGAGEIYSDLRPAPFMGAAELRYGPVGFLADALHVPLEVPITTRNIFYSGGNSAVVLSVVTGDLIYRVLDQPNQTIDAGLGFRVWGASADTTLNGRLLPTTTVDRFGAWTDPLIAARYHRDFGNGFGLTAYGDVGGFGIAAHTDWEIIGTLDYALKPWLDLSVGYRSLNVSYSASEKPVGYNVRFKGPLLGATMRF